jgi:predicted transport protein
MKFSDIFEIASNYYPLSINIADGKEVDKDSGNFHCLSESWREVEIKTNNEPEYIKLMIWAIFCGLHKLSIEKFKIGEKIISLNQIDKNYVAYKFEESFFDNGNKNIVENLKNKYINDLK